LRTFPRADRLPTKFFHEFAKMTRLALTELTMEMKTTGQLHSGIKKEKTALIPKPGNQHLVTNYRPITLLNSTYKIQAKLIATRLKPMLSNIIRPSQTSFVPGHSILDNIFAAQESMEWVVES